MNADHCGDLRVDRLHQNTSVSGHIIHQFTESGPFGLFALQVSHCVIEVEHYTALL